MLSFLIIMILIAAILLIAVILLQPGKGDLTATFGGIGSQFGAVFGMQKAGDILSKTTKVLAIIILVLVLMTNKFFVAGHRNDVQVIKPVTQGAQIPVQQQGALKAPPIAPPAQQQQQQPQGKGK